MNDSQRDDLIISTHGLVAGMVEKFAALETRQEDHTGRLLLLEADTKVIATWRSKITGAWIAGSLLAAAAGTIAALVISMLR